MDSRKKLQIQTNEVGNARRSRWDRIRDKDRVVVGCWIVYVFHSSLMECKIRGKAEIVDFLFYLCTTSITIAYYYWPVSQVSKMNVLSGKAKEKKVN